jgi:NTP pyrophosphatase (non-canonical NTP hydrolase)
LNSAHHGTAFADSKTTRLWMNLVTTELNLAPLQQAVDQWIRSIGVRYFSELTNLAQLMEEVGELARQLARRYGDQSFKPGESNSDLADEIADVLFVLVCLANQTGVDLSSAFAANLAKKTNRDAVRHSQNEKLRTGLQ